MFGQNQMRGSELWPRKVELVHAHSKIQKRDYRESLYITAKPVITPNEKKPYHSDIH